jgi:hypothetical protein
LIFLRELLLSAVFRDGCDWLFQELHKYGVPLLILSAGIGDIILEAVKQRAAMYDNIEVVSNFMEFNEQVMPGSSPVFTSFSLEKSSFWGTIIDSYA